MKLTLTFKTPDVVDNALDRVEEDFSEENSDLDMDEFGLEAQKHYVKVKSAIEKFVEYGELIRIEIDTDQGTAQVLPVHSW